MMARLQAWAHALWQHLPRHVSGRQAVITAGCLAGIILLVVFLLRPRPATVRVQEICLGETLEERGILESAATVPVGLGAGGEIRELAADGAVVKAGEVVVRVDETQHADRLQRREVEFVTDQMSLAVGGMRRDQVQRDAAAALVLASNRLALAVLEQERIQRGLTPAERRRLEVALELRRIEGDEAAEALAREQVLVRDGLASPASLDDAERRLVAARMATEEAGIELAIRTGPPREEDLLEAVRKVVRLQGECDRGQRAMARRLEKADARIAESQARVAMGVFEMAGASNQLARCAAPAPTSGVFRVRWFSDWRRAMAWQPIKPGVTRGELDRVADIVQPGSMRVLAMIHEADIATVATGRSARVTIPALNDRAFAGTVVALGGVGRDRYDVAPAGVEQSVSGVTVFNTTLALHGDDLRLRPGMSARIVIETVPAAPRLLVPREAVGAILGDTAEVVRPGGRRVTVTGRLFGPSHFWVRQGLQLGDRILARYPSEES